MRTITLTFISVLILFSNCNAQPKVAQNTNGSEMINSIFDRIEAQGVDTKQKLLYGYFFFDNNMWELEKVKNTLVAQSYRFINIDKKETGEFLLHVEKTEQHTRQSLQAREQSLRQMAAKYNVSSFDGFDVGNANPGKPLISDANFARFMLAKNGNELFDLAIRLYDLGINAKAELVFKECISRNIKPDTAAFKLGNTLIAQNKVDDGINSLAQATKYNPNYVEAYFNIGAAYYDNRKFQKSIHFYQQADKLKPNDDRIVYGIAAAQYAIEQFEESLKNCKKALEINRNNEYAKLLWQMLQTRTGGRKQ